MPKAVLVDHIDGANRLIVRDIPVAKPGPGEVRYRVYAFGLNRADLMYVAGFHFTPTITPSRIGHEACGIVDAVGDGVADFAVGDRVTCLPHGDPKYGVAGEFAIVLAEYLAPWPEHLSAAEAASVWMQYCTAYYPFCELSSCSPGTTALITAAASSAGIGAVQLAKRLGATVIGTSRTAAKADFIRAVGADHVITEDGGSFSEQIFALDPGAGVNLVYDSVGGGSIASYADALALDARIFFYGALSGAATIESPILPLVRKGANIQLYSAILMFARPGALQRAKAFLGPLIAEDELRPIVDRTFAFDDALEAYGYLASGNQRGKVVVEMPMER